MNPVPVARSALYAVLAFATILLLLLTVRPLIFTFAPPRDDSNYALVSTADASAAPLLLEVLLNERHGLPGEAAEGEHARLWIAVAPDVAPAGFSVVDAWSPTHDCVLALGADRLVDCAGDAWTYAGVPIDPAHPPLVRFPTQEAQGAVVVDFTRPIGGG